MWPFFNELLHLETTLNNKVSTPEGHVLMFGQNHRPVLMWGPEEAQMANYTVAVYVVRLIRKRQKIFNVINE